VWDSLYGPWYEGHPLLAAFNTYTFLFEIVYPANRIVLDYGDMDDLVLLGAVQKSRGYYVGPEAARNLIDWPGPVVETFEFGTLSDAIANMGRKNAEGFVVRAHNFMVKIKEPDYVDLHRLVTNASPKTVWEQLVQGRSKTEIVSNFPDEFHTYIESMVDPLLQEYERRFVEITNGFSAAVGVVYSANGGKYDSDLPRKEFAKVFSKSPDAKYYFQLLDNRSIKDTLWKELRPRVD
jgi:RNA ligase